jgi:NADPH:quinone reductase
MRRSPIARGFGFGRATASVADTNPSAQTRGIGERGLRTKMKAAWYEKQGAARDVLIIGEIADPQPRTGEVRIRVAFSGVNPGDVKKREDAFGIGMSYPRVIPHSDGSGTVDAVGEGVPREWIGRRVWCYGAQSYRPFGTAAEFTAIPLKQVVQLPEGVPLEQGACLGIPGITAHRAVHVAGSVVGQTVLVQGGAGAVGACAVQLAHHAGARVIASNWFLHMHHNELWLTGGSIRDIVVLLDGG